MSEYYFKAPSAEEVAATYDGMTFEEFRLLDDDTVEAMRLQARERWFQACAEFESTDDEWEAAKQTIERFISFCRWRTHGIPDRDETNGDFLARMHHHADTRRRADPHYGQISVEDFVHLDDAEHELTGWIFDDIWADGEQFGGQYVLHRGGYLDHVIDRVHVGYDDLVNKDIIEPADLPAGVIFEKTTGYVLVGKFAAYMFNKRYPER